MLRVSESNKGEHSMTDFEEIFYLILRHPETISVIRRFLETGESLPAVQEMQT